MASVLSLVLMALTGCSDSDSKGDPGLPGAKLGSPYDLSGFELPGNDFFPEGIASTKAGAFFVGSVATGAVVRFLPGQKQPEVLVPGGESVQRAVGTAVGLIADEDAGVLWLCDADLAGASAASAIVGVSLDDGHVVARHPFPQPHGFCNDVALDQSGNLYASDSSEPRILRVPRSMKLTSGEAAVWATDPAWTVAQGEFTLNGIEFLNDNIYVVHVKKNALYRVPVEAGGAAGQAVAVALSRTPNGLDGLKAAADGSLIFVEVFQGQLVRIALQGDVGTLSVLADGLDGPTTFTLFGGSAWVVEGQLQQLNDPARKNLHLPFRVVRKVLDPSLTPWPQQ